MVLFLKCAELCQEEGANDRHEKLIEKLNKKFGKMSCYCHPTHIWEVGVDLMDDCKYRFHHSPQAEPKCGFRERLIKNEVQAFLLEI